MIILSDLNLSFVQRELFKNLNLIIQEKDRIGLVGRNGFGKSTLLKVIANNQRLDSGTVSIVGDKRIAYLNQEITLNSQMPVLDFVTEHSMQDPVVGLEPHALVRAQADKILRGLGFTAQMLAQSIDELSGGWKMRVVLAQLLVLNADFYLFDEPTNHLDIVAKDWFLQFLKKTKFGFLLVCHEKYFLNQLCTKIFALDTPQGKLYQGNYDSYITQQAEFYELQQTAFVQQQKMIKKKQDFVARFRASANRAAQAQSVLKELEEIEIIELPQAIATMHIAMPEVKQSGTEVIKVAKLSGGYEQSKPIFTNVEFIVKRGEKIALVAANGVGKTTLLHTIAGQLKAFGGNCSFGHAVTSALFHQEQMLVLDPQLTIWQEVNKIKTVLHDSAIRAMLGSFLFSGDDIHKKISMLSGGEKSRVGMIKVLLQQANLLLLDEPTNHLDIPSKDILLKTLKQYPGTLLFVSHDHDFINQLATTIIELTAQGTYVYAGNYEDYLYQKSKLSQPDNTPEKLVNVQTSVKQHDNKLLKNLEVKLDKLAKERERLTKELEAFEYGTADFSKRYQRIEAIQKEESQVMEQWEQLYTI